MMRSRPSHSPPGRRCGRSAGSGPHRGGANLSGKADQHHRSVRRRQQHRFGRACWAEPLGIALKQAVTIENKSGANGAIGAAQAARAAADGYTLFMATNSPPSAAPTLNRSIAYDPVRDFAPVVRVGSYVFVLAVDARVPIKSIPELVAYAKANPGKLSYASGNTTGIVAGETLKRAAGIDMLHVPYKSTPPAVSVIISNLTPVPAAHESQHAAAAGRLRVSRAVR